MLCLVVFAQQRGHAGNWLCSSICNVVCMLFVFVAMHTLWATLKALLPKRKEAEKQTLPYSNIQPAQKAIFKEILFWKTPPHKGVVFKRNLHCSEHACVEISSIVFTPLHPVIKECLLPAKSFCGQLDRFLLKTPCMVLVGHRNRHPSAGPERSACCFQNDKIAGPPTHSGSLAFTPPCMEVQLPRKREGNDPCRHGAWVGVCSWEGIFV